MSAINFVVRDGAGNLQRGSVAGDVGPSSIVVGAGADVSLNLSRTQIIAYTRQGQALQLTLLDGRVIVIEGFFTADGVAENQLFISADGYLTEVHLTQGAGADYYANFIEVGQAEKFALSDDLYFVEEAGVMLADNFEPADDQVGMFAPLFAAGAGPLLGLGGAAAGAAVLLPGGGGGGGDDVTPPPEVAITAGTSGAGDVVNEVDYNDGVDLSGTGTPGATIEVVVEGVTKQTVVGDDGIWTCTYVAGEIPSGTYETDVSVTVSNGGGSVTVVDKLTVDTELDLTFESATVEGDGVVNLVEGSDGVTLTGTVESGSTVVVTIDGQDYTATVSGGAWSVDLAAGVIGTGEMTQSVTVTATDTVGNVTTVVQTVTVDTVTAVSLSQTQVGNDYVINAQEHSGGVTLTGSAEAGASVVVVLGTVSQTVTADASGNWSAQWASADLATGETTMSVSVTSTDLAGNTATASGSVQIDTFVNTLTITSGDVGGDGVVNLAEAGQTITVTGQVEVGSSVSVALHNTTLNASVDANGNWTVTFPAGSIPGGEYATSMVVTATDAAGNSSSLTEAVQVDTVAGDVALSAAPIELDDVINFQEASDGVWISGTATPGLQVTVGFGGTSKQVFADANGNFSVLYGAAELPADTNAAQITASITDAAGNFKEVSDTVAIDRVVENYAFSAGPVEGNNVVSAAEAADGVQLSGSVEPYSQVVVSFGGETQTVVAGANGSWTANFTPGSVRSAEYTETMTAVATDPAGNVKTITNTVQIDTIVNTLTTAPTVEGDDVVNAEEARDGITLVGTVEQGSTVMVQFQNITRAATVDANGNWSVDFTATEVGVAEYDANVTITATDAEGNTASINDTFRVDTKAPDMPNVETVTLSQNGVEYVGIETTTNDVTISEVTGRHSVNDLKDQDDGVSLPWGETLFQFNPTLADGSHLVVTETDTSGNESSTYLVLEETGTNDVDLNGLGSFDIGAIDLSFAKDSELTLDVNALNGLSDENNDLIIHGGADDSVFLTGATAAGSTNIDGKTYDIYTMGQDGTVFIEDGVGVIL